MTSGQASEAAVAVVATGATVVHLRIARVDQRRRVAVAVAATRRINPDQDAVVRRIDRVGGFPAIRMTGRTGVRAAFMAHRRADQSVGAGVMTGRTAVMNLVVAATGKGRRRIRMTHRTPGFDHHITRGNVIDTMIR